MYNFEKIDSEEKKSGSSKNREDLSFWERMYIASQSGELSDYEEEQLKIALREDSNLSKRCLEIKTVRNLILGGFKYLSLKVGLRASQKAKVLQGNLETSPNFSKFFSQFFSNRNLVLGGSFAVTVIALMSTVVLKIQTPKQLKLTVTDNMALLEMKSRESTLKKLAAPSISKFEEQSNGTELPTSSMMVFSDPQSANQSELDFKPDDSIGLSKSATIVGKQPARGFIAADDATESQALFENDQGVTWSGRAGALGPQSGNISGGVGGGGGFESAKNNLKGITRLSRSRQQTRKYAIPQPSTDEFLGDLDNVTTVARPKSTLSTVEPSENSFSFSRRSGGRSPSYERVIPEQPSNSQDKWYFVSQPIDADADGLFGINPVDSSRDFSGAKTTDRFVEDIISDQSVEEEQIQRGSSRSIENYESITDFYASDSGRYESLQKGEQIVIQEKSLPALGIKFKKQQIDLGVSSASKKRNLNLSVGGKMSSESVVEELAQIEDKEKSYIEPASELEPHPETETQDNPLSTFSLNVSEVSFRVSQAALMNGQLPEKTSIRSEEFINAFDYKDPIPGQYQKVAVTTERALWPFEINREIIRIGIRANQTGLDLSAGMNLVLLLDTSGSMEREDRAQTVDEIITTLVANLGVSDSITLIGFSSTARLLIDGMPGGSPDAFLSIVNGIRPSGGTNIEAALDLAYEKLFERFRPGGNNRILMLTDGAANLGEMGGAALSAMIEKNRVKGAALDCFGIGWDGYDDTLLERLTRNGDGKYGFLNSPQHAGDYFKNTWLKSVEVSAKNVKVQVEFNPNRISRYRQMGYQKHRLTAQQFRDNSVDAGEIGKAESGNALYILEVNENGTGPVGWVRVRYQDPDTLQFEETKKLIPYRGQAPSIELAPSSLRLASAAGSFAEWLGGNPYAGQVDVAQIESWVDSSIADYEPDTRPLALKQMVRSARALRP